MRAETYSRKDLRIAAFSLLCVLLVAFTGFVQAVHVHAPDPDFLTTNVRFAR